NRPTRRVYAMAPDGEAAFQHLLRESLAGYEPYGYPGATAFLFLHAIPSGEAIPLLEQRRARVKSALEEARAHEVDYGSFELVLSHQIRHLETEFDWLDQVVDDVASVAVGQGSNDHSVDHVGGSMAEML
ncbi:hypothetical protein ACFLWA_12950, partial [Chloroflexota bacterium]